MATTTRRRLDPALRRAQIIDAAEQAFLGRDPTDVTFEEVAEAAGGEPGARLQLLRGPRRPARRGVPPQLPAPRRRAEQRGAADLPPTERLRSIIRCYLDFASTDAAAWRLIGSAEASLNPVVRTLRRRRDDQLAEAWGGTPTARVAARAVVGMLEAATLDWLERRDCTVEEVAETLFVLLWGGLSDLDARSGPLSPTS